MMRVRSILAVALLGIVVGGCRKERPDPPPPLRIGLAMPARLAPVCLKVDAVRTDLPYDVSLKYGEPCDIKIDLAANAKPVSILAGSVTADEDVIAGRRRGNHAFFTITTTKPWANVPVYLRPTPLSCAELTGSYRRLQMCGEKECRSFQCVDLR